jgi:hypothetical protein
MLIRPATIADVVGIRAVHPPPAAFRPPRLPVETTRGKARKRAVWANVR